MQVTAVARKPEAETSICGKERRYTGAAARPINDNGYGTDVR